MDDLMRECALDELMEPPKKELLALAADRGVALPRKPTKMQIAKALIACAPEEEPSVGEGDWIEQAGGPAGALRNLYAVIRGATGKEFLVAAERLRKPGLDHEITVGVSDWSVDTAFRSRAAARRMCIGVRCGWYPA